MAVLLLSGIAIASLAISAQGFDGVFAPPKPPEATAAPASAALGAARCAECGVIESTRIIEVPEELIRVHALGRIAAGSRDEMADNRTGSYVITVRLQDGTMRTITDARPAQLRPGEYVTVIGDAQ
ncbi:MAG TPA: hypothetical protein VIJ43_16025 [Burkholderiales bacterium]